MTVASYLLETTAVLETYLYNYKDLIKTNKAAKGFLIFTKLVVFTHLRFWKHYQQSSGNTSKITSKLLLQMLINIFSKKIKL